MALSQVSFHHLCLRFLGGLLMFCEAFTNVSLSANQLEGASLEIFAMKLSEFCLRNSGMITITLIIVVISLISIAIYWGREINQHWKRRGIKHKKPILFFGNMLGIYRKKKHYSVIFEELYEEFPEEPIVGFYDFTKPWLQVQDADYVEKILIKDFPHFVDHGFEINTKKNPIDDQLFSMVGKRWRAFRYKLSPIFTSGKLKSMFESMIECGDDLEQHLKQSNRKQVDMNRLMALYTMDVIGSSIFGIQPKAIQNPNSEYCRLASNVFNFGFFEYIKFIAINICPALSNFLGSSFNKPEVVKYFCKLLEDAFRFRRKNNIQRNDFIQLLMALKEKQTIEIQSWDPNDDYLKGDEAPSDYQSYEINDNILMAQAYSFLVNGIDGIAITETNAFLELAQNPEIQEKVRTEIQEQIAIHKGLTYEALKHMTYLDKVIKETLRIHPAGSDLFRICTKQYTFPNGFTMKEGDLIRIPVNVIHNDPNYFPDPKVFKPERFDISTKPGTYLPFGDGPRVCIAMRFASLLIKLGIAKVLFNFRLKVNSKTKLPIELQPTSLINIPLDPLLFDLEEINAK